MDASSSAHPYFAFLPGHLLLPSTSSGPSGKVGFELEQHSCSDALACLWIQMTSGRDPAASPDHHPLAGETRAARRRQCFFAALHFLDFYAKPGMANVCVMYRQKGQRHCLKKIKEKKKKDLVNLAMIIQEVCGRAANKIQTFCLLGLRLHNTTVLPLGIWACCLIGTRCSACLLKGKECWESHALIL